MWPLWLTLLLGSPAQAEAAPQVPPAQAPAESFDELLRKQPFFKKILWTTEARFAPFEILIQKQAVPEAGFEECVAQFYGPWLAAAAAEFESRVAKPALLLEGLDPRPPRLIVLLSEGDYVNYSKSVSTWDGFDSAACYDERIRAVVARWDAPGSPALRRYRVLRRFTVGLLHQRSTAALGRQGPLWIREGLGRWLAWHTGNDPKTAFAAPGTEPALLDLMMALAGDPAKQNRHLLPLATLASVTGYADLRKRAMDTAKQQGFPFSDDDPWHGAYLAQSSLWVEFLMRPDAPQHNAALGSYLRAGQRGGGSPADLRTAFGDADLAQLDREFFLWAAARLRDTRHKPFDDARLSTLFAPAAPAGAAIPADPGDPGSVAAQPPKEPLAKRLAVDLEHPAIARALALRKAAAGDLESAERDLEAALARPAKEEELAGLRADLERIGAWRGARDTWLAELSKSGGKLQVERDGKLVSRRIASLEAGVLALEWPQGTEKLAVTALAPSLLATQMKATPAGAPEWVRAFAWILGGESRWEKQLRDKSEAAQALRADATGTYPALVLLARTAAALSTLASAPEPSGVVEARGVLDRLTALRAKDAAGDGTRDHPLVIERLEALRELAGLAAGVLHDAAPPPPGFSATSVSLDADVVDLTYDFASPAELDDWVQRPLAPDDRRFTMQALTIPEDQRKFSVQDGSWTGRGAETLEHRIPLGAPLHLEIVLRHGYAESEEIDIGHFLVGICNDPRTGYLAFAEAGESFLEEFKTGRSIVMQSSNRTSGYLGDPIPLELVHDGNEVRYVHLGVEEPRLPKHEFKSGGIFLISKTNRVLLLDKVRIQGRLNADSRAALRERWIARTVAEAGL